MNQVMKANYRTVEEDTIELMVYGKRIPIFWRERLTDSQMPFYTEAYLRETFRDLDTERLIFLANVFCHEMAPVNSYEAYVAQADQMLREVKEAMPWKETDWKQRLTEHREVLARMNQKDREFYDRALLHMKGQQGARTKEDVVWLLMLRFPRYIHRLSRDVVKKELWKETTISRIYHENSKLRTFHQQGDFMKPIDEITEEIKTLTAYGRKKYPGKKRIALPAPTKESKYSVEELVMQRRSRRHYKEEEVSLTTLSNILYYSYGVTGQLPNTKLALRAVPSGGGLYPVDVYIAVNHVESLTKGIYYYDPLAHELVQVNDRDLTEISTEVSGYAAMIDKAAFTFLLGANFWRNQWKYHERGYRVILIDCGHVAQNLHMMATAYDLGSCCLMGFVDDEIDHILELDGVVEHSMYVITVGVNR